MPLSAPTEGTFQVQQRPIIQQQQWQAAGCFPFYIRRPKSDDQATVSLPTPLPNWSFLCFSARSRFASLLREGKPKNIPLKFLTIRLAAATCRFSGMEGGTTMNVFVSTLSAAQLPSVGENDLLLIPKANGPNLLPL